MPDNNFDGEVFLNVKAAEGPLSSLDHIANKLQAEDSAKEYFISKFQLEEQGILKTNTPLNINTGLPYKMKARSVGIILGCHHAPLQSETPEQQNKLKYTVSFFVPLEYALNNKTEWGNYILIIPEDLLELMPDESLQGESKEPDYIAATLIES